MKEKTGWNTFMDLRRQALHNMQQLSADAEKAGSAGMTLDGINAEIAAARSGTAIFRQYVRSVSLV